MKYFSRSIALIILLCISPFLFSQSITHIVQKSETLYSLGKRYGVSEGEIRSANNMGSSNTLYIGQKLIIPGQENEVSSTIVYDTYIVQSGDTIYSLSRNNDLTSDELLKLNGMTASSVLKVGQKLKIPTTTLAFVNNEVEIPTTTPTTPTPTPTPTTNIPLIGSDPREVSTRAGDTSLLWPVKASEVAYVTGKISGVALTGVRNEEVTVIRSGTVMFSGIYRGFGQVVFVQATTGHIYVYTGLGSLSVSKGQYVPYGHKLGQIGNDTLSGKHRMNLMVFQDGNPIDPAKAPRG